MIRAHQHIFLATLLALTELSTAAASVRVVDTSGTPGTFTSIQAACDQSADGDVVLVQSGNYASFALVNKGITVSAYPGATVHVGGGIRIRNLAASKTAVLIGLVVEGAVSAQPNSQHGLAATSNSGALRLETCEFRADLTHSIADGNGASGAIVDACANVMLSHCFCLGGVGSPGPYPYHHGGSGISATASEVTAFDSVVRGGLGMNGNQTILDAADGGAGYQGRDSTLFASKVRFEGGYGGDAYPALGVSCGTSTNGLGGNALLLWTSGDLARLVSTEEYPGWSGLWYGPFCATILGSPGLTRVAYGGATFVDLPVTGRSMSLASNPIHEGSSMVASLTGTPGDPVALIVSFTTASQFNPLWNGQQMFPLLSTTRFLPVGIVPANGTLTYGLTMPDLGPGLQSRTFFVQPLFGASGNQRVLGTCVPMIVLDSGI